MAGCSRGVEMRYIVVVIDFNDFPSTSPHFA